MAGVLFIVNVPRKEYETHLNKDIIPKIVIEKDKYKSCRLLDDLKENRRLGTVKTSIESFAQDDDKIVMSKCKSTDCLRVNEKEVDIYKCNSEIALNDNLDPKEKKSYLRSSWKELKQVISPRKCKLRITEPGTEVDILASFQWDTPLETILSEVIKRLKIKNATWNSSRNDKFWQVTFSLESGCLCEELLQVLRTFGVGSRHQSSISMIPCALYFNSSFTQKCVTEKDKELQSDANSAWSRFSSSVRARTNLAQVLHDVRAEAALTFDWLFLLVVAAFVAAIGLVENSTVILVASMLISPLMGPITAGTLGTAVRDRSLQLMGVTHELLGLFLSLIIGFIFGLAICAVDERYGIGDWPTYEMLSRCEIRSLWVGILVAIPSGAGVALAVLGDYTASLVGVAISASLLPPAVNAGLLWAMALVHLIFMDDDTRWTKVVKTTIYSRNQPTELAVLGSVSLCLTLVNIICIFLAGVAVYKVKEVCPLGRRNIAWWRTNKNLMHTNKFKDGTEKSSMNWDFLRNWYKEEGKTDDNEANFDLDYLVKANNIEKLITMNNLNTQSTENGKTPDMENIDEQRNKLIRNETENNNKKFDVKYQFYEIGFDGPLDENNTRKLEKNESPTIEPSLSVTVDAKSRGLVLDSKSFDV